MRPFGMIAVLLGIAAAQLFAQPGRPFDMRPTEKVDQLRKVRMIDELDLKEEQSVRFFARLNEFDKKRKELMKAKHEALDNLERLVKENADEKELEKSFPAIVAFDQQMAVEKSRFCSGLSDILSVSQRAKLLTFERNFERELREAVRETQKRRMRADEP